MGKLVVRYILVSSRLGISRGSPLDVLWGQPIKLIQVASHSELRENQWKDLIFFEIVPSHSFGASEVQT